jgi:hypothetical protein
MLVGGDIVQKALAQLVGVRLQVLPKVFKGASCHITPVAFSFGWIAYAFSSLASIIGDQRLMPSPDIPLQVINLSNGYVRDNNSWVLGRLLRDHENSVAEVDQSSNPRMAPSESTSKVSLKIDIFIAGEVNDKGPTITAKWYVCWVVIILQQVLAAIPWILDGDWGIFLVTVAGTLFAVLTGSLPQWVAEKWPAPKLRKEKTVALTRGNGHQYVMVLLAHKGAWDVEAMSSARLNVRPETSWVLLVLAVLWSVLLITVSGLQNHTWYLVGVGGLGMLQNVYVSASSTSCKAANLELQQYPARPTITGYQRSKNAKTEMKRSDPKSSDTDTDLGPEVMEDGVRDVMGALMELEKVISNAGAALLPVFFPGRVEYDPGLLYSNSEKRFWKCAAVKSGRRRQSKLSPNQVLP